MGELFPHYCYYYSVVWLVVYNEVWKVVVYIIFCGWIWVMGVWIRSKGREVVLKVFLRRSILVYMWGCFMIRRVGIGREVVGLMVWSCCDGCFWWRWIRWRGSCVIVVLIVVFVVFCVGWHCWRRWRRVIVILCCCVWGIKVVNLFDRFISWVNWFFYWVIVKYDWVMYFCGWVIWYVCLGSYFIFLVLI